MRLNKRSRSLTAQMGWLVISKRNKVRFSDICKEATRPFTNHPVCAVKEASASVDRAAAPPLKGGEWGPHPHLMWLQPHTLWGPQPHLDREPNRLTPADIVIPHLGKIAPQRGLHAIRERVGGPAGLIMPAKPYGYSRLFTRVQFGLEIDIASGRLP